MKISVIKAIVFALLITLFVLDNGCKDSNTIGPDSTSNLPISPATLADNIPYSALGSGKIAFERINDSENYAGGYVIDVDSQKSNLFIDGSVRQPSISPDGSLIAFLNWTINSNTNYDVYVINTDGSNKKRVSAFEGNSEAYPSWRPDGSIIYRV